MHQLFVARLASHDAAVKCLFLLHFSLPSPRLFYISLTEHSSESGCCSRGKMSRLADWHVFSHFPIAPCENPIGTDTEGKSGFTCKMWVIQFRPLAAVSGYFDRWVFCCCDHDHHQWVFCCGRTCIFILFVGTRGLGRAEGLRCPHGCLAGPAYGGPFSHTAPPPQNSGSRSIAGDKVLFHKMGRRKQTDKEVLSQRQATANQHALNGWFPMDFQSSSCTNMLKLETSKICRHPVTAQTKKTTLSKPRHGRC